MEHRRVSIQWTSTAKEALSALPPKVRRGLVDKIDELYESDPRSAHKALTGPLHGFYRVAYSRFRAIYKVDEELIANGDVLLHLKVIIVAAGKRKEHDKKDIYKLAKKIVQLSFPDDTIELKDKDS